MSDLKQFSVQIVRLAGQTEADINRLVKKIALAIDQTVVLATPVDTGRARSNWIVALGSGSDAVIPPYSPLSQGRDPSKLGETGNARAALAQGQSAIASRRPEQTIYISNNVDYIGLLNEGTSAQAPPEFVKKAIEDALNAIRNTRIIK